MANLIIKSSADNLVLQGSDASPAITVGATGIATFAEHSIHKMYGFKARTTSSSGTITTHSAWQEVGSGTSDFGTGKWAVDRVDGAFSVDTGRYTPAKAGFYAIHGTFSWNRLDDNKTLYVTITKNATTGQDGANILAFERQMGSTSNQGMAISLSGIIELNGSSDYVSMFWNDSNTNNTSVAIGTQLSGYYLGI